MSGEHTEIEAKFYLRDFDDLLLELTAQGWRKTSERVYERNLRFDTSNRRLTASSCVLRLRQDVRTVLTYKQARSIEERTEIEVEVDDFDSAKTLLEMLGFEVFFIYEKYRETFALDQTHIMLDELPFGYFVEIESDSLEEVKRNATKLNLIWERRARRNYLSLFDLLQRRLELPFRDATFENFSSLPVIQPADLDLTYAREHGNIGKETR